MYLPNSICTTQNTNTIPPSPDERKRLFRCTSTRKGLSVLYIPEVGTYPRKKSRISQTTSRIFFSGVSIIRFFAWQEGEFAKRTKKRGSEGIQAGRLKLEGRYSNIIQYRYRYIVRMFRFSYLVVHGEVLKEGKGKVLSVSVSV